MGRLVIGQFYPAPSLLHRLDARVKISGTLFFIISLFWVEGWTGYLAAFLALCTVIKMSMVPPRLMIRGLRPMLFILVFTASLNVFLTPGETMLAEFLFFTVTVEGIEQAAMMAVRLIMLIVASTIMTLTTTPIQLTDAIESLFKPLKLVKAPIHEMAMMMTIALRFVPTLVEEVDKIMKAQMARGADFDTGGLIKKAKGLIPLLVPLFISAFRRADELAQAMDARCYRGDINRTKMKVMKLAFRDFAAIAVLALYGALILALPSFG